MNYSNFAPIEENKKQVSASKKISLSEIQKTPFLLLQNHKENYFEKARNAVRGTLEETEISKIYFSKENIKRIQRKIREEIYKRTRGYFKLEVDQDEEDLIIAMRAIYFQKSYFEEKYKIRQIKKLNVQVVNYIVPDMITQMKQEYKYLQDINKPLQIIPRPINCNKAGSRTLPQI